MYQTATISGKRQLTIPASLYRALNFQEGQKVIISQIGAELRIQSALDLIETLAGSLLLPSKFRGQDIDKIIAMAKQSYIHARVKKQQI